MLTLVASIALADPVPTLCDPGTTAFSCATGGGKVLSICASAELSTETGWIQYRFGRPGAIELAVPPTIPTDPHDKERFVLTVVTDPTNRSYTFGFSNGDTRYAVYESWIVKATAGSPVRSAVHRAG